MRSARKGLPVRRSRGINGALWRRQEKWRQQGEKAAPLAGMGRTQQAPRRILYSKDGLTSED